MNNTPSPDRPLRLGTRSSPLALAQAELAADALCAAHGWTRAAIDIVPVVASGDKVLDRPLADIGGKALWTKELDAWLAEGQVDISVHSMKDVETIRPDSLKIAAILPRADMRDRLLGAPSLSAIRQGGVVGTSSPRRAAQIRRLRPDLSTTLFRGNVQTRMDKLARGEVDATLLAAAGLDRLGMGDIGIAVDPADMLPAPAQGAIGLECLSSRADIAALAAAVDHADSHDCVMAERAVLLALGGTCHSPIAAFARMDGPDHIDLRAEILSPDGQEHHAARIRLARGDGQAAQALGRDLLALASADLRALFTG